MTSPLVSTKDKAPREKSVSSLAMPAMDDTSDTSDTSDEDYLAEYRGIYGTTNPSVNANPFLNGQAPTPRPDALRLIGEVLYAARMPDGLVKIGWSTNLWQRLNHQTLRGATLLAIKAGSWDDEQALHDNLAADAHHGREWYWPTPTVLELVDSWRQALGLTPLDLSQFAAVHPESEQSTYGRGPRGRFTRQRQPEAT